MTTSTGVFTVTSPAIQSFAPASASQGTTVTITGVNFTGVSSVTFNSVRATSFTVNSSSSISAVVPAGVTTGRIKVSSPAGSATSDQIFTGTSPAITSFSPTSGKVGISVVLTGVNFTGATSVSFNTQVATYTVNSAT